MNEQLMCVLVLERAGHAKEIAQTMVLEDYYGIVIVSGDGLVYEVIYEFLSPPVLMHDGLLGVALSFCLSACLSVRPSAGLSGTGPNSLKKFKDQKGIHNYGTIGLQP